MSRPTASRRRSESYAWLITGPLVVLTIVMFIPAVIAGHPFLVPLPEILLYLAVFIAAEAISLTIEMRGHGTTITLTEIPLVVALFYLPPLPLMAVRIAALVLVNVRRRTTPVKLAFNIASQAASIAAALFIVTALGLHKDASPRTWLILCAAAGVATLIGVLAVLGVISLIQGGVSIRRMIRTGSPGLTVAVINITLGLVVFVTLQQDPWSVVLLAVLAAVLAVAYRAYGQFLRQHRTLAEIYELTKAVRETRNDTTLRRRAARPGPRVDAGASRPRSGCGPRAGTRRCCSPPGSTTRGCSTRAPTPERAAPAGGRTAARRSRRRRSSAATAAARRSCADRAARTRSWCRCAPARRDRHARGGRPARRPRLASARTTCGCWRRSPRTPAVAVENSRLVDRLRFDAYHDALTELPNRRRLHRRARRGGAGSGRSARWSPC